MAVAAAGATLTFAAGGSAKAGDFPGFAQPQNWVTGALPTDLEAAFLDPDPFRDLLIVNRNAATLFTLEGVGDGTFMAFSSTPTLPGAEALAVADFDGDGRPDAAVVSMSSGDLAIHRNLGDGSFAAAAVSAIGPVSRSIETADFNSDGHADLLIAHHWEESQLSLLLGNGDGTFQAAQAIHLDGGPVSIDVHDIDGDGHADIGIGLFRISGYVIEVLFNDGSGGFAAPIDTPVENLVIAGLSFGDLDGDGVADCAAAHDTAGIASAWKGDGDGMFTLITNLFTNGQPETIDIVDLNNNGTNDIVVVDFYLHRVNAIIADGKGGFAPHMFFEIADRPTNFAAADFDNDGFPEVASAHEFTNSQIVSVLKNLTLEGTSAALVNAEAAVGEILFGTAADLDLPRSGEMLIESGFGTALFDLHHLDLRISAVTNVANPATFNLGLLTHFDEPGGVEYVRFLNHATGEFERVVQGPGGQGVRLITGIDATGYVSAEGDIEMSLKQIAFVPFLAFRFFTFADWVDISVVK